jgi:hypothetical protein
LPVDDGDDDDDFKHDDDFCFLVDDGDDDDDTQHDKMMMMTTMLPLKVLLTMKTANAQIMLIECWLSDT